MAAKFKEVESFIKFLVHVGGIFELDSDGYVINKGDDVDDPVLVKVKNQYKRVMSIKEVITDPDALILNPLNENAHEPADVRWLYTNLAVGLARRVIEIVKFVKMVHDAEDDPNVELSAEVMQFVSKYAKRVDDNTILHLSWIAKSRLDFINIFYRRKFKEARFRCSLFDQSTRDKFPKVTKKSWKVLTDIVADILGVSKDPVKASEQVIEKFTNKSELLTSPKLEAILGTYYKVYSQINGYLDLIEMDDEDFVVDLTEFGIHLSKISDYYDKTKWFTGVAAEDDISIGVPSRSIPVTETVVNSNIPRNNKTIHHVPMTPPMSSSSIPVNTTKLYGPSHHTGMPQSINTGRFTSFGNRQPVDSIPTGDYGYGSGIPTR